MKKYQTIDLTYSAFFICLMAIGSNITFWIPFLAIPIGGVSVPVSLQTFISILAGIILGKRLAAFSIFGYLLLGIAGVPVFAQMQSGIFVLFGYTGGFLLSFIVTAYLAGLIIEIKKPFTKRSIFLASLSGTLVNYLIGVTYMYIAMNTWMGLEVSYYASWVSMIPFLIKDLGLSLFITFALYSVIQRLSLLQKKHI
ncbi:biotin transport system substrate-specific component [Amphibacillus marinus]|uniref:Biotin transporter n=1 Tax=Amphibacillus marinus TaxID=872970 RepID=A0A1H8S006_9BACI|nr:biotin transporter BioY [Amphibacillus marinus]SEO72021.1 biotin transport system substrate-specific component [Amphibacillus marinus]